MKYYSFSLYTTSFHDRQDVRRVNFCGIPPHTVSNYGNGIFHGIWSYEKFELILAYSNVQDFDYIIFRNTCMFFREFDLKWDDMCVFTMIRNWNLWKMTNCQRDILPLSLLNTRWTGLEPLNPRDISLTEDWYSFGVNPVDFLNSREKCWRELKER